MNIEFKRCRHIHHNVAVYVAIYKNEVIEMNEFYASKVEFFVRANPILTDSELWNGIKKITNQA